MNCRVHWWVSVSILVAGCVSASFASEGNIWKHFAVRQVSHQLEDPFEEEPAAPAKRLPATEPSEPTPPAPALPSKQPPAAEPAELTPPDPAPPVKRPLAAEPSELMPPDPAYQIPAAPSRVQSPAPLIPPDSDSGPIPPPPTLPPATFAPREQELWQPGCSSDGCGADVCADCPEEQTCSPFRRMICKALHDARYEDCDPCCSMGLRNGGLPLGIRWEGWVAQGATLNTRSPGNRSNFPVTFNDRSNDYQLNQLYLVAERAVRNDAWSVGGRIDLLYGTDHRYTMARGLEIHEDGSPKWNSEDYGLAMPQLYMEAFAPIGPGVNVKMGHFYTILGYETVPAPENFFYSHTYAMQYGEPFTHTGCLAATEVGPVRLQAGLTRGWDNWENGNDDYGFLGGVSWTSHDERTSLAFALHTGREEGVLSPATNSRTTYSMVFSHDFLGPWSCVFQHDMGIDRDVMQDGSDATWYGMNMYLFREITEEWKFGYRFEWFRDNDGTRVVNGQSADYYQMAWGLNYSPSDRLCIRPSLRWDWTGARNSRPFINGTSNEQLLLDCDVLIQF